MARASLFVLISGALKLGSVCIAFKLDSTGLPSALREPAASTAALHQLSQGVRKSGAATAKDSLGPNVNRTEGEKAITEGQRDIIKKAIASSVAKHVSEVGMKVAKAIEPTAEEKLLVEHSLGISEHVPETEAEEKVLNLRRRAVELQRDMHKVAADRARLVSDAKNIQKDVEMMKQQPAAEGVAEEEEKPKPCPLGEFVQHMRALEGKDKDKAESVLVAEGCSECLVAANTVNVVDLMRECVKGSNVKKMKAKGITEFTFNDIAKVLILIGLTIVSFFLWRWFSAWASTQYTKLTSS